MLELRQVEKSYGDADRSTPVLRGVDLRLEPGSFSALVGPSGSGKSTLLHLAGLLDRPSRGSVRLGGVAVEQVSAESAARLRNRVLGFVFQAFHLLPRMRAWENVALPLLEARRQRRAASGGPSPWRCRRRSAWSPGPTIGRKATVRRRASARGHRPCPGPAAATGPRRRADRQPGQRHRRRDHGPSAKAQSRARDGDDGHPRCRPGRPVRPADRDLDGRIIADSAPA